MCGNRAGSKEINRSPEVAKEIWKWTEQVTLITLPPGHQARKLCDPKKLTIRLPEILILKECPWFGSPYGMCEDTDEEGAGA